MLRPTRPTGLAVLCAAAFFAALASFGARVHWVEEAGTAERDGYVTQAEQILTGDAPRDPFRPPLYPYAVAGLATVTGDAFTAARLLSNLSAAALALLAFGYGRRLAGPEHGTAAGAFAMALVAANPNTWVLGQHVTTDMPFAALAAAAGLAALAYLERPGVAAAAAAGLAYGAAACTRGNAILLLPGLLAAWWLGARTLAARANLSRPGASGARRNGLGHLALALAAGAALLLPHWLLRARAFGGPFYDENWKNLVWKLHGYPDWSRLTTIPAGGGYGEILLSEPGAVLAGAASELWRFAASGLSQLLGTPLHGLAALAAVLVCVRRRPRPALWLLATLGLFTVGVATAFFAWGRFLLVLLPAVAGLTAAAPFLLEPVTRRRRLLAAGAALLVGVLAVKTALFRLPAFVERHPYADVAALRRFDGALAPGEALAGTAPFLGRYLVHSYIAIPDAFGDEVKHGEAYSTRLVDALRKRRAAYLVVGASDLRDRPLALLSGSPAPPGLALVEHGDRLTVWRVLPAARVE